MGSRPRGDGAAVRPGDLVAINTGWHRRYLTPGQDRDGAHFYFTQHRGLCTESAQWLVERGVATVVLIDTPAIDSAPHTVFGDETWQAHAGLFEHNIPVVEHLGGEIDEVASRALYYQLRACEVRVWGRVPPPGAGVVP